MLRCGILRQLIASVLACLSVFFDWSAMLSAGTAHTVDRFDLGGISVSSGTGSETAWEYRMRSGFFPLGSVRVTWDEGSDLQYLAAYYDGDYGLLTATGFRSSSGVIRRGDVAGAEFVRFILSRGGGELPFEEGFRLPEGCRITSAEGEVKTFWDAAPSPGTEAVIQRVSQCVDIRCTARAALPMQGRDAAPGTELSGLVYSSTRRESLYVPNAVSFETYLTALNDPHSYIYTRVSDLKNSRTYYGTVCSAFVSYCYDLPCIYTTHQLGKLDRMELPEEQGVDSLRLGDLLLKEDEHVAIVVAIERDARGKVLNVEEAEALPPCVRRSSYSRKGLEERFLQAGYRICRDSRIDEVAPPPAGQTASGGELPAMNRNLCPRRGDKANWPAGEAVEIDVLDAEDYGTVELYRDGRLVKSEAVPKKGCIRYRGLDSGSYAVCLSSGERRSDFVRFIVADTAVSAEALGNGIVKISFSSSNAVPEWFAWCYPNDADPFSSAGNDRHYLAAARAYELTEEDLARGYAISAFEPGRWCFKVEFRTEYGLISSDFASINVR